MQIEEIRAYDGPSIFSHKPVVRMKVCLEELADVPTKDIENLNELIVTNFPGLAEHECSRGYKGGFLERLEEGTYLAHVTEHLCLELQNVLGYDVKYGKSRHLQKDRYQIVYAHKQAEIGAACGIFIVGFLNSVILGEQFPFENEMEKLGKIADQYTLGPSTQAIVDEARKRGIPVQEIGDSGMVRLGYGMHQKYVSATLDEGTSSIAVDIACDKSLTKAVLKEQNIPIPEGRRVSRVEEALAAAGDLGYPVVVKPKDGNQGKGVFLGISCEQELKEAFPQAEAVDSEVIVEKQVEGKDYRLLVVNGRLTAVSERIPAHVLGDGIHSIEELIEMTNQDPRRGEGHEKPLTKIKVDENVKRVLKRQGLQMSSTPKANQRIWLRENGNLSTGGLAIDRTDIIHPRNKEMAELAAKAVGLDIAGIDMVIPDISKPIEKGFGAIVEVNAAPGIRMHLYPSKGQKRDVVSPIVDMLYPKGSFSTIPIISITGTNGKTTTTRMIGHILRKCGIHVGMTTTHGIYIDDECAEEGDTTGPISARRVLYDRRVEAAVLETARGGIVRDGLAYTKADVAVFTNLTGDHLGVDGIETMEDLFYAKSLVVEAVKPDGASVLNADDPWVIKALDRAKGRIVLYSMDDFNPLIREHAAQGGQAVYVKNDWITLIDELSEQNVIRIKDIPAALNGALRHNVYNSMAAVAAAYALGVPVSQIAQGMMDFSCSAEINPGRFNIYDAGKGVKVVLDYGHNLDGYKYTIEGLKGLCPDRLIGIIGMPGDRKDEDLIEVGRLSGESFHKIFIREDEDLRGRRPLETAGLLKMGIARSGMLVDEVEIIPKETEALQRALECSQKGDAIVVFFEKREPLVKIIKSHGRFKEAIDVGF